MRAFGSVGGKPFFAKSGEGPYVIDVDGNKYIDYICSWGPLIFGHRPKYLLDAINDAAALGTSFGIPTERELSFARLLVELVPSIEMLRLVNSGTEATMSAIRLARGFTGRDYIIKCNGCYHGHADSLLVAAGSGVATFGIAGSPGIPEDVAKFSLSVEFNDLEQMRKAVEGVGSSNVACIIIEPVPGNMGLVLPEPGYLAALRDLCDANGIVLIFDEVMSGFRVALGGAQERFGVTPDITTLGKVIGGGLPIGAFGGKKEIMEHLAPSGPVYQAGTLSGNPIAVAAGLATLEKLRDNNPYSQFEELGSQWTEGLSKISKELGIPLVASSCGAMLGLFFSEKPVRNYSDAKAADAELFKKFFSAMLDEGVYLAPSPFEASFISTEHSQEIIEQTLTSARKVLEKLA